MKKYWILILGIALFACSQQKGFKIEVNLEGAEGQILLENRQDGKWNPIDTADIVEGVAVLEGEVAQPGMYYLSVMGERGKTLVFVENANMKVSGKADSIFAAKITGSATHDDYAVLDDKIKTISNEYRAIYKEAREASSKGDTLKAEELMKQVEEKYNSVFDLQRNYIKENPKSFVSPVLLTRIQHSEELDSLEILVNSLDISLMEVPEVVQVKERIAKMKKVAVGQIAPDFTQNDPEGNPIKFSDVYSKHELTLLDFWASWCGPCRHENPNVVAVFNDFKDKGFTVFGVSLDKDKDAWLKGIADDQLTWTHVSDLSYWSNAAAQLYAVSGIPHSILIDKNGKIIAKNKREDELRKAVEEFFAK